MPEIPQCWLLAVACQFRLGQQFYIASSKKAENKACQLRRRPWRTKYVSTQKTFEKICMKQPRNLFKTFEYFVANVIV